MITHHLPPSHPNCELIRVEDDEERSHRALFTDRNREITLYDACVQLEFKKKIFTEWVTILQNGLSSREMEGMVILHESMTKELASKTKGLEELQKITPAEFLDKLNSARSN